MTNWLSDFFEIDLDNVQEPNVTSWGGKGSPDEMKEWMLCVKEIQKLCREKGFTTEQFQKLQTSNNPNEKAIYDTYCHLYEASGNNLKVVWEDKHYSVDNGNHRILIAKQMGLRHLPAQVKATDVNTIAMLKAHGEKIAKFEKPLSSAQKLDWLKQVRMPRSETQTSPSKNPNLGYR
jgi:hypothetical protein